MDTLSKLPQLGGLERPYVILTELIPGHLSRYESRMHIAATRATVGLTIVCSPEALNRDPRLRDLLPEPIG